MTKRTPIGRVQLWAAVIGLLTPLAVLAAASPSDALQTGCAPDPVIPGGVLCVYTPANSPANFVVPPGVSSVDLIVIGADGGSNGAVDGGDGARLQGSLGTLVAGDVLSITAGRTGKPGTAGAFVFGGAGGGDGGGGDSDGGEGGNAFVAAAEGGAGGGGASSVVWTDNNPPTAADYVAVAGGGGGAGGSSFNGADGGTGGDTAALNGAAGGNGTGGAPGAGGGLANGADPVGGPLTDGAPGFNAVVPPANGGGGGGGGGGNDPGTAGGGGGAGSGGGGGSAGGSFNGLTGPLNVSNLAAVDGRVELRYNPCVAPSQVVLGNVVVREGDGPGTTALDFPITVVNPSNCTDVVVNLQAGGPAATALLGSDYTVPDFSILIPSPMSSGVFTVLVNGDTQIERTEFLFARIVSVEVPDASEPAPPPTFNPQPRVGVIRNDDGVIIDCVEGEPLPAGYNPIAGTNGDDDIAGSPGDDIIFGFGGDDRIVGNGGNDIICGGPGRDRLAGGVGNDQISGDGSRDRLLGGDGDDDLVGGPGYDTLLGGAGTNTLMP